MFPLLPLGTSPPAAPLRLRYSAASIGPMRDLPLGRGRCARDLTGDSCVRAWNCWGGRRRSMGMLCWTIPRWCSDPRRQRRSSWLASAVHLPATQRAGRTRYGRCRPRAMKFLLPPADNCSTTSSARITVPFQHTRRQSVRLIPEEPRQAQSELNSYSDIITVPKKAPSSTKAATQQLAGISGAPRTGRGSSLKEELADARAHNQVLLTPTPARPGAANP